MKYIAYLKQAGEGCDYTIGCGQKLIHLKSDNLEDAKKELKEIILGEFDEEDQCYWNSSYSDERELDKVTIFGYEESEEVPVKGWYREKELSFLQYKKSIEDEKEKLLYETLKKKYENSET